MGGEPFKLNLGCAYVQPEKWENVDVLNYGQPWIEDVLKGLHFPDNHFDFVLMNHTLQMFTYDELPVVLKEVRRVMKLGATLRILTPNMHLAAQRYLEGYGMEFPISDELEKTQSGKFARYLFWHGDTHCAFDDEALEDLLKRNGFNDTRFGKFGECELDSRKEESLIMTCQK